MFKVEKMIPRVNDYPNSKFFATTEEKVSLGFCKCTQLPDSELPSRHMFFNV